MQTVAEFVNISPTTCPSTITRVPANRGIILNKKTKTKIVREWETEKMINVSATISVCDMYVCSLIIARSELLGPNSVMVCKYTQPRGVLLVVN